MAKQRIEDFKMHEDINTRLQLVSSGVAPVQLTLFPCCDTKGHSYQTRLYVLLRENTYIADIPHVQCFHCGHRPPGHKQAFNRLQYRMDFPMTLAQVRKVAQEYLAVTQSSRTTYHGVTVS
jgi:hypothetical protein